MSLKAGSVVLGGRFRVQGPLASGGMGEVYLAEQMSLGRQVALKVLRPDVAGQAGMTERLRREAALLAQVDHPAVVRILDFGEQEGSLCLVLERIEGTPLNVELEKGPLLPDRAITLLAQLLEGLAAIHARGIVHRDLTPKNVMLTQTVLGEKARLLDFGIARLLEPQEGQQGLTAAGTVIGTPEYLAPERMKSNQADARSDLYSFGVLAYEMLSGELPFPGPDGLSYLRQHLHDAPRPLEEAAPHLGDQPRLCALVMKCLAKTPEERPESAKVLVERFLALPPVGEPTLFSESRAMPAMTLDEAAAEAEATARARIARPPALPVAGGASPPRPTPLELDPPTEPTFIRPAAPAPQDAPVPLSGSFSRTWAGSPGSPAGASPEAAGVRTLLEPVLFPPKKAAPPPASQGAGLSLAGPRLRQGLVGLGGLLLAVGVYAALTSFLKDNALEEARGLVERRAYKDALAVLDRELGDAKETRKLKLQGMKAAALHGLGQHRDERKLLSALPPDSPAWREPLVLGSLVEDLGRKDETELRSLLSALPKPDTHALLQRFLDESKEPSAKHWAALRHLDREKALEPASLVKHYLIALEARACGVKAAAATRLGELGAQEASEPLQKVRRSQGCGDLQAAQALKALEKKKAEAASAAAAE